MTSVPRDLGTMIRAADSAAAVPLYGLRRPEFIRDEVLAEIFSATAAARPAHPAMICAGRTYSYSDVDAASDAIARGLNRRGVGPGDVVGLWMPRGADLLVAQIGVAKSGAAWLPFDAEAPVDRIATCLADAAANGLVTNAAFVPRAAAAGVAVFTSDDLCDPADTAAVDPRRRGLTPDHPAYVIYTSGSTGAPKGIVVTHRNVCHYLRAGNALYGVGPDDRMFQSASVAFDLSVEEIWIPYLVGATLWVATSETMAETDQLADRLRRENITVIDTVPTLLAMVSNDVPSLRLVILGGEALQPSVVQRWARDGRRLFNTYGPTETTVVATACEVRRGEPVTIGGPIPNYSCYVVGEDMRLLPPGVQGELLIGGPGVAKGYVQREELTAEKFIANPFPSDGSDPVLYRSGDAVSLDENGAIVFHGRLDDQVKIRGFRVELGEIEVKLDELPDVAQAAVVLRNDEGLDRLVAFVVPRQGSGVDRMQMRVALAERLPTYMVPSRFELVDELPRLVSGKIDRKSLQAMKLAAIPAATEEQEPPRTPTEAALLTAARRVFPGQTLPFDADFFTDLGGHSLIAARFVSALRETPVLAGVTLQDVYAWRTLRAMAAALDGRRPVGPVVARDLSFAAPPLLRRFLCGLAQAAALPFILGLMTAQWLGLFVCYMLISGESSTGFWQDAGTLLGVYGAINVATVAIAIAGKWLILGRTRPGRYPLWGVYYYRWWLTQRLVSLVHAKWAQGTPLMRAFMRAMGARVGADAIIADFDAGAIDLLTIGRGASIGGNANFANAEVVGGELVIGRIAIGDDAVIGSSCVLGPDVVVGDGAELGDLSSVPAGWRIGDFETWDGSPVRKLGETDRSALAEPPSASRATRALQGLVYAVVLLIMPPVGLLPIFPAFYLFDRIDDVISAYLDVSYYYYLPLLAWPTAMGLVVATMLLIAAVRWSVLPRMKPGTYSVHSWFYVRKWIVGLANEVTLETLSSLYATVFMCSWYRLMGAKIGRDAEISANLSSRYDLVEIGDQCFIADEVLLGEEDVRRGWMQLGRVKTQARVFVGNSAVVPPGAVIPTGSLIGIKSKPPANEAIKAGDTWFGSPAIHLPTRQRYDGVSADWTYNPSRAKRLGRGVFEAFRLSMPTMLFITFGTLSMEAFLPAIAGQRYGEFAVLFLAVSVAMSVVMTLTVVAVKWALMGRYEPTTKPMWSWWALRTEAVAVVYNGLAGKVLLDHLRGTPMLPWALRLFGARIGEGAFINMTDITEFDCVNVGDHCAINASAALQTHLYEDRVMKIGRVKIGDGVTVGAGSTVLYDTHVGDFARLGPLTLVMKGESLPAHSEWVGAPAISYRTEAGPAPPGAAAAVLATLAH